MKTARISLAVVSGILLALGCAASSDHAEMNSLRIVVGLMFGTSMAISMIFRPERVSRKMIYFLVAPLVLALIVHEVRTGTRAEAIVTIAFVGVQLAFASLPPSPGPRSI